MKCILCDLEIPKGKESIEHYLAKSRVPMCIWNNPKNKFYAHYMLNAIKSNYLPCEFFEMRYDLTNYALANWRIKQDDREFLEKALISWQTYNPNPCALCLAKCNQRSK